MSAPPTSPAKNVGLKLAHDPESSSTAEYAGPESVEKTADHAVQDVPSVQRLPPDLIQTLNPAADAWYPSSQSTISESPSHADLQSAETGLGSGPLPFDGEGPAIDNEEPAHQELPVTPRVPADPQEITWISAEYSADVAYSVDGSWVALSAFEVGYEHNSLGSTFYGVNLVAEIDPGLLASGSYADYGFAAYNSFGTYSGFDADSSFGFDNEFGSDDSFAARNGFDVHGSFADHEGFDAHNGFGVDNGFGVNNRFATYNGIPAYDGTPIHDGFVPHNDVGHDNGFGYHSGLPVYDDIPVHNGAAAHDGEGLSSYHDYGPTT